MNFLSLFDGMSCGQIALERVGIHVSNYFASEIDKYAIKITQKNYPNTIQLGDINNWKDWNLPKIDLILAGSPCQGFSNAGLGLNFDDPRSKLFFVFVDILKHYKPEYFFLENVKMKKEWQDIISNLVGVQPIMINSALVSAQNRKRLYWTNWNFEQPEDKKIFLKDILENNDDTDTNGIRNKSKTIRVGDRKSPPGSKQEWDNVYVKTIPHGFMKEKVVERSKYPSIVGQDPSTKYLIFVGGIGDKDWAKDGKKLSRNYPQGSRVYSSEGKATSLSATGVGGVGGNTGIYEIKGAALRNQVTKNGVESQLNIRKDDKSNCVVPSYPNKLNGMVMIGMASDINGYDIVKRIYSEEGKGPALTTMQGGHREPKVATDDIHYRKLTPLECERLQTVPDNYTEEVSNSQRYKMLGNGWTVDVIAHILSFLPKYA